MTTIMLPTVSSAAAPPSIQPGVRDELTGKMRPLLRVLNDLPVVLGLQTGDNYGPATNKKGNVHFLTIRVYLDARFTPPIPAEVSDDLMAGGTGAFAVSHAFLRYGIRGFRLYPAPTGQPPFWEFHVYPDTPAAHLRTGSKE